MRFQNLLPLGLPMVLAGSPAAMKRAPTGPFNLYAYGDGIGGAPVFTSGDVAYLGNKSELNDAEASPVLFTVGASNTLYGSPNVTDEETTPSWSNVTFYVPGPASSSHTVGFTNSTPETNVSASGFIFYGQFALHENADGNLETLWYATPTEYDGVWSLDWNTTDDESEEAVLVTLKSTAPSKPLLDKE
ncbi:Uu.00g055610.m01.CDS01 [Anthostomella pinea]|uniref:Uu.00g055610.m01.CDS01 n=1 Tax=Anthostomella pinea TaxID=933095 RepID=A0AAI8YPU8_9PEZI|nr:Uu.00g055610.m01.CDS01 [Anthostomella pinea]